jgi:hypothetical protein
VAPTLTDRDVVQEELQTLLRSGNACLTVGTELFVFPLAVQNDTEVKMCGTECAVCGCGEVPKKGAEGNLWT